MKNTLLIIISLIPIFFLSCDKQDDFMIQYETLLPLNKGNYWKIENRSVYQITGVVKIDNKEYYQMKNGEYNNYYRISDNKVYVIEFGREEGVKFNLSANLHETWRYTGIDDWDSYVVELESKTDVLTINGQKIENCYRFYFDIPMMAEEEHTIWLAPGIGFVQEACGFCYNPISKLEIAHIRGRDYRFK
jgi:hypothetical protein